MVLAACHHGGRVAVRPQIDPSAAYTTAMRDFRHGKWGKAQSGFQRVQFEMSARDTLVPRARFYLAETYASLGEMVTAAREFRRVADDYPADSLAPYALLRVGDQYARLWKRPELDPSNGETALASYQELLGRYPDSHASQLAEARVREIQNSFARKDYQNGLWYMKRGAYDSAILYFSGMIAKYPSSELVPDAFIRLVQSYRAIGYHEELEEKCAHLRQYFGSRADVRRECGNGPAGR